MQPLCIGFRIVRNRIIDESECRYEKNPYRRFFDRSSYVFLSTCDEEKIRALEEDLSGDILPLPFFDMGKALEEYMQDNNLSRQTIFAYARKASPRNVSVQQDDAEGFSVAFNIFIDHHVIRGQTPMVDDWSRHLKSFADPLAKQWCHENRIRTYAADDEVMAKKYHGRETDELLD